MSWATNTKTDTLKKDTITIEETKFLNQFHELIQQNIHSGDSLINSQLDRVAHFSDNCKMELVVNLLMYLKMSELKAFPDVGLFHFKANDSLLFDGLVTCFRKETIATKVLQKIKNKIVNYTDPSRSCVYYVIAACETKAKNSLRESYLEEALKLSKKSSIDGLYSLVIEGISQYYTRSEQMEKAVTFRQKGLDFAIKHHKNALQIHHLSKLGNIHLKLGNLKNAEEFLKSAFEMANQFRFYYMKGRILNYLGSLHNLQDDFSNSIQYLQKSLIEFYKVKAHLGIANAHKNLGFAFYKNGNYKLAERNYYLSEQYYKELKLPIDKGELYFYMAKLFYKTNTLQKAEQFIKKAVYFWKDKSQHHDLNKGILLYSKIEKKNGNMHRAYAFLERYIAFNDSSYKHETQNKIAALSELYRSEQKERKIVEQEQQIEDQRAIVLLNNSRLENTRSQNRLILIILVISVVLFVSIVVIIRYRNKQEQLLKKQREIELQQALMRTQMNPHFIFNAMSVIQSYIYDEDISNSSKFLIHFSRLMRLILENNTKAFIPLDIEIEILERYLAIQKLRFENRFEYTIELNEKIGDNKPYFIPPMLIQPFVENAIEHGDLDQVENGFVHILITIEKDLFIFTY